MADATDNRHLEDPGDLPPSDQRLLLDQSQPAYPAEEVGERGAASDGGTDAAVIQATETFEIAAGDTGAVVVVGDPGAEDQDQGQPEGIDDQAYLGDPQADAQQPQELGGDIEERPASAVEPTDTGGAVEAEGQEEAAAEPAPQRTPPKFTKRPSARLQEPPASEPSGLLASEAKADPVEPSPRGLPGDIDLEPQPLGESDFQAQGELEPQPQGDLEPYQGNPGFQPQGDPNFQEQGDPDLQPRGDTDFQPQGTPDFQPQGDPDLQPQGDTDFQPQGEQSFQEQGEQSFQEQGDGELDPQPQFELDHQLQYELEPQPPGDYGDPDVGGDYNPGGPSFADPNQFQEQEPLQDQEQAGYPELEQEEEQEQGLGQEQQEEEPGSREGYEAHEQGRQADTDGRGVADLRGEQLLDDADIPGDQIYSPRLDRAATDAMGGEEVAAEGADGDGMYGLGGDYGAAGTAEPSPTGAYGQESDYLPQRTSDDGGAIRVVGSYGGGGGSGASVQDTDALVAMERERFTQQLQMEVRAREELEDMILRIEKHFKAEQAARKKAEELLQAAIAAELDSKNRLEDVLRKRRDEQRQMEEERNGVKRERNALEGMRQDFEAELQAARSEVAKAQDALAASEDRIRAAEAVDRARLESEYQAKITSLQDEITRLRDELAYRTHIMSNEMTRWQQQANLTAAAVMDAKNEVMERKRELDSTKEKMDLLLEKLYIGRERGMELSGAIAAAQSYAQHAGAHSSIAAIGGMMPPAMLMAQAQGGGARGVQLLNALPPLPGHGGMGPHSNIPKLPPVNGRPPPLFGEMGPPLSGGPLSGGPLSAGQRRSAPGSHMAFDGGGGFVMPGMGMGYMGAPPGMMGGGPGMVPGMGMPGMGMGQQGSFASSPPGAGGGVDPADPYAHVQSRFAQPVESAASKQDAGKKGRVANGKGGGKKQLDRFEESKRDEARLAAMAKRWG